MKHIVTGIALVGLATCLVSGCATADRSGHSFTEGRNLAQKDHDEHAGEEGKYVCSKTTRVGSNMRQVVCRSREVIQETSDRAQNALRDRSQRIQIRNDGG